MTKDIAHHSAPAPIWRRTLLASLLAAACATLHAENARPIDIAEQALAPALARLAEQSGLRLLYPSELLAGRTAPALHGTLSPAQALDRLLAGSGLRYRFVGSDAVRIEAIPAAPGQAPQLAPVVVAATRTATPLDRVAAPVSVIERENLAETQAATASAVLKQSPGVDFGGGPRSNGEIPTLRGYSGKSVTLLVDGARQNSATSTLRSPLYLDPYFISQAEVLRGSGSSLYGPGGTGGVISFRTLSVDDLLDGERNFGGNVRAGHASADESTHLNASLAGRGEFFDALVALGEHDWTSIRQGRGTTLSPNEGSARTALAKLGLNTPGARYELSHLEFTSVNRENSNPQANSTLAGAPAVQNFHTAQAQTVLKASRPAAGSAPELSASLYHNDLKITADPGANPATAPYSLMRTETDGASLQGSWRFGEGDAIGQRLSAGGDYFEDHQTALTGAATNPVIPNGRQQVGGVFVQDEIALGESWRLTPSLRGDHFSTSTDASATSNSASHLSPKLVVAWQALAGLDLYASYGESFRAPSISELYWNLSGSNFFSNFKANPDLKPEIDTTLEIGANFARRNLLASGDRLRVRANVFDGKASDLITQVTIGSYARSAPFVGTGGIFQYQNVAEANRRGGELEANYLIGSWQYRLAYSHIRITDASNDKGLFSPPDKLNLQIRKQLPAQAMSVLWSTTAVAAQDYDATLARQRPGYTLHDLYLSWQAARNLRLDAGVSNLFDKRYSAYQSSNIYAYTYAEGRSLRAALSADF